MTYAYSSLVSHKKKLIAKKHYQNEEFLKKLGIHCRKLRLQRGYSIDRISKESEQLSTSVIHRLETGQGSVTVNSLLRYAEVLEVTPKALFDFPYEQAIEKQNIDELLIRDEVKIRAQKYRSLLPLYTLKAAAGAFGNNQEVEPLGWIAAKEVGHLNDKMFVIQAVGHSMEPLIRDGDYVVFSANPAGTRQGKIVLAQYQGWKDPETMASYTIKKYNSAKIYSSTDNGDIDSAWRHRQITLSPLNKNYEPILIRPEDREAFSILAEYIAVLKI